MSQEECATRKCGRRTRTRVGNRVLVASALLLLLAGPRLVGSQSNSSAAPSTPHTASPAANAETLPLVEGLKLTDDQKTRIAKIRQHVEARREAIIKNEALNQDRKETILQRLNLIETSEIFRVLTPDQQKEVQKRIADRRASEQQEQHQSKHTATASPATASPTPAAP
jgi:Spy/CpxP family protein refolding chaperone